MLSSDVKKSFSFLLQKEVRFALITLLFLSVIAGVVYTRTKVDAQSGPFMFIASTTPMVEAEQVQGDISGAKVALKLQGKDKKEIQNIKAQELAKLPTPFSSTSGDLKISIEKINEIENGIEVFVKAWENGEPVGFGTRGRVEIERIKIINPPILIQTDKGLSENLAGALSESIFHIVSVIGQDGKHIEKGKVGNTTTTVYPDAGTGGTTVDGAILEDRYTSWSSTINSTNGRIVHQTSDDMGMHNILGNGNGSSFYSARRVHFGFDTSSIPDTDAIALATFSVKGNGTGSDASLGTERRVYLTSSSPSSNGSLSTTDFDNVGTTSLGVSNNTWSPTTYNNIPLNTDGINYIDQTGVTNLMMRGWYDFNASAPDSMNGLNFDFKMSDYTGTASDPELIIEHASCGM